MEHAYIFVNMSESLIFSFTANFVFLLYLKLNSIYILTEDFFMCFFVFTHGEIFNFTYVKYST